MQWKQLLGHKTVPKLDTTALCKSLPFVKNYRNHNSLCWQRGTANKVVAEQDGSCHKTFINGCFQGFSSPCCLLYAECVVKTIPFTSSELRRKVSWDCSGVSDRMPRIKALLNVMLSLSSPIPLILCSIANLSYHKSMSCGSPDGNAGLCYIQ